MTGQQKHDKKGRLGAFTRTQAKNFLQRKNFRQNF